MRRNPMTRILSQGTLRGLVLAASVAGLAGCATSREPIVTGSVLNDGYKSRHPILITEQAETIDLPIGSQAVRLTDRDANTVKLFGTDAVDNGAARVTVLLPKGSANEAAAKRIARQIGQALAAGGVPSGHVAYHSYPVTDPGVDAPVRLAYPRMKAGLDHRCGQWPDQVAFNKENADYWNYGCATQANFAAMVVNPTDLVTPRGTDPANATRRQTIFKNYENGEETVSKQKLENDGTITDLSGG